jgi:hypothetical protein
MVRGHVVRIYQGRLPKRHLYRRPELVGGKRRRGRTRLRMLDVVERDAATYTGVGASPVLGWTSQSKIALVKKLCVL